MSAAKAKADFEFVVKYDRDRAVNEEATNEVVLELRAAFAEACEAAVQEVLDARAKA